MSFSVSWHTLLDELDNLPEGATLITPLSHKRFRITDVQEHRVVIEFVESDEEVETGDWENAVLEMVVETESARPLEIGFDAAVDDDDDGRLTVERRPLPWKRRVITWMYQGLMGFARLVDKSRDNTYRPTEAPELKSATTGSPTV